jgi:hypothetical protein
MFLEDQELFVEPLTFAYCTGLDFLLCLDNKIAYTTWSKIKAKFPIDTTLMNGLPAIVAAYLLKASPPSGINN